MKKLIIIAAILSMNMAYATTQCIGLDPRNKIVKVLIDPASNSIVVNGDVFKIEAKKDNGNILLTGNFINVEGVNVYDAIILINKVKSLNGKTYIIQVNATKKKAISFASLACHQI